MRKSKLILCLTVAILCLTGCGTKKSKTVKEVPVIKNEKKVETEKVLEANEEEIKIENIKVEKITEDAAYRDWET